MKLFKSFFAIIVLMLVSGCQQEPLMNEDFDNLSYIALPQGADINNLNDYEIKIVMSAFSRMKIVEREDGLCELMTKSGAEVNVSEEIYCLYQKMIEVSNSEIISGVTYSRSTLMIGEEGGSSAGQTDCLARSIAAATGKSYDEINRYITQKYGNGGVPASEFYNAVSNFGAGSAINVNSMISSGNYQKCIIVIDSTHAVNAYGYSNGYITYWDYQNNAPGYVDPSRVTHAYRYN